jgi:hypothetical protein
MGFNPIWCSLKQKSIGICIERVGSFQAHSPNRIRRDLSDFLKFGVYVKEHGAPSNMVAQRSF